MITDVPRSGETTLTFVQERAGASFRGIVDATNLEIFRDFLGILRAGSGDVVVGIAELEMRVPEATSLLVETARTIGPQRRLILTIAGATGAPARSPRETERVIDSP